MKTVPHGYYSKDVFLVEPLLAWFTSSELGLNVWTVNPSITYNFTIFYKIISGCEIIESLHESYSIKENGIIRFGPLTDVINIKNPPSKDRYVKIYINCCNNIILKLKYKIPEFWPLTIPKNGDNIPSFNITIGSCMRLPGDTGSQDIFPSELYTKFKNRIISNPKENNLVFSLGDSVYINNYNYDTKSGLLARYRQLQKLPELEGAWSSATWSAITDDHEMSINDGTLGAPSINLCRDIFSKIWPSMNPFTEISPILFSFTRYDISFIGLDNRSYRTNPGDDTSTILGEKQFIWLKQCLYTILELGGPKSIIFIAVGTPLIPPGSSSFLDYPIERERIINLIQNEFELKNVFILSGDVHFSDVSVLGDITEIRNSALSSPPRDPDRYPNPYRIPGSAVGVNNFGTLDISGTFGNRTITYKTQTSSGVAYDNAFIQK